MAIVNVKETWSHDMADADYSAATVTRGFTVLTDNAVTDDSETVRRSPQLPQRGQTHPRSKFYIVTDVRVERLAPKFFLALVTYTRPVFEPALMDWSTLELVRQSEVDADGKPLRNTAGDPLEPPLEWIEMIQVLSITRNQEYFDYFNKLKYEGTVNSRPYGKFHPLQCRIARIDARQQLAAAYRYWTVGIQIWIRLAGWREKRLNQGFRYYLKVNGDFRYDDDNNKVYQKFENGAQRTTEPVLLDAQGFKLDDKAKPILLEFRVAAEADWAPLKLPVPTR